jgi:uncharacterized membrane protein (UPF0127 family)
MSIAKISILICSLLLLAVSCVNQTNPAKNYYNTPVFVSGKKIQVEVADTDFKRVQGLSGRKKLKNDQGMLFVFETPGIYSFWMQDMKFDLDLIWVKDKKIIGITANVPHPLSSNINLPLYSPPEPIDAVLEVNAGWSKKNGINVGDKIRLENLSNF